MNPDRDAALALFPVSRETEARIDVFLETLRLWQARTNLVAPSQLPMLWTRHVADSLQLIALAPNAKSWIDIGSGGGFPGAIVAAVTTEDDDAVIHLTERNGKKAAFLREALRAAKIRGQVHACDIYESAGRLPTAVDVITARAVAPLEELLRMSAPWLGNGAKGLFLKGQDVESELRSATISWDFAVKRHASRTGSGTVLEIRDFRGKKPIRMPDA